MARTIRHYDERSLARLEWSAVLSLIALRCGFAPSREAALAIRPALADPAADRRRTMTVEIGALRRDGADPHIGGAADLRPALDRAEKGGTLDGGALFAVAETLRVGDRLRGEFAAGGPLLQRVAEEIAPIRTLRGQLDRSLAPDGTLSDAASPTLGGLRANHRVALERLRTRLEGLAHAKEYSPYLQEPIVTLRNGRYVLPVRAEAKSKVPGIVHDSSATGQTIWIEPLAVVELGNAAREAESAVAAEEARIYAALTALVAAEAPALRLNLERLTEIDLARATADAAAEGDWNFADSRSDDLLALRRARHPLLLGTVVPIDLELSTAQRVLLTGPNTGGKTVALKTVGLLTAMHHSGLPIPADAGSGMPPTGGVWADIGDDQSIAQSLSTFSGHLTSILRIHAGAERGDLILLDEAGAGTDPAEGAALAAAIIDDFRARGMRLLATSHFAELKQYAHVTPGVVNGAVEFDLGTLRPTYRLIIGTPGGSQAFAIAERLGLPASLLTAGQARRSDQGVALDASLTAAAEARQSALDAQRVAEGLQRRADEALQEAVATRRLAQDELHEARRTASAQAAAAAAQLLTQVEQLRATLTDGSLTLSVTSAAEAVRSALARNEERLREEVQAGEAEMSAVAIGDEVQLRSGARGEVIALDSEDRISVALGGMRLEVPRSEVAKVTGRQKRSAVPVGRPSAPADAVARLDLRGARVEDALVALEARIDALLLAGGERLEIIHGVGTGALRDAVRRRLRERSEVREVRDADTPGRDGVTIALL